MKKSEIMVLIPTKKIIDAGMFIYFCEKYEWNFWVVFFQDKVEITLLDAVCEGIIQSSDEEKLYKVDKQNKYEKE